MSGKLDERSFRRVEKFDGADGKWKEWSFLFKTQVGAANKMARNLLDEVQKMKSEEPDMDTAFVSRTWWTRSVRRCTACSQVC